MVINENYPNREELFGVERWINCYRSGDYVGRFFWTPEDQWKPSTEPSATASAEFCLIAGAHTHYFDETAVEVGRAIDHEITDLAAKDPGDIEAGVDAGIRVPVDKAA